MPINRLHFVPLASPVLMHLCPHCHQPVFSDWQKLTRLWLRPRVCPLCQKAAFLPVRHVIVALMGWTALSWGLIGMALYTRNVLFLLGIVLAGFFAADLWIRKAPLQMFDNP